MRLFILMWCLYIMKVMAQAESYQLKGSLGINSETKKNIDFTLKWTEEGGKAMGTYSDNFYTQSAVAKGISGDLGRIFVITFPQEIKGVQTISFLGSDLKTAKISTPVPVSVVLRDKDGKPVNTTSIQANLSVHSESKIAQKQEDQRCQQGFGALAGYCGIYTGMLTEEMDTSKKCNLLDFNNIRLVLDENGEIGLVFGELSSIVNPPVHRIGRIFTDQDTERVDILSRNCRPLQGVAFKGDNCKRLDLVGNFRVENKVKRFAGTYTILDEKTNESCRYGVSMEQTL